MGTHTPDSFVNQTPVNIRLLKEEDLPALEWDGEYTHFRRLYREIFKNYRLGKALMWGVEVQGTGLIGQVFIQIQSARPELANGINRAYIYSFRIKPPFRNQGIGSKLLNTVEMDLIERKNRWATLNVARDNQAALRFYLRHGYQVIAAEAGYWTYQDEMGAIHEVHEPAWRLQKDLLTWHVG
jgi:ribosomal protein S18 acetylase RimI-like enzyme